MGLQRADAWDEDEDDLLGTQEQEERAERAAASAESAMEALAAEAAAAKDQMDAVSSFDPLALSVSHHHHLS